MTREEKIKGILEMSMKCIEMLKPSDDEIDKLYIQTKIYYESIKDVKGGEACDNK